MEYPNNPPIQSIAHIYWILYLLKSFFLVIFVLNLFYDLQLRISFRDGPKGFPEKYRCKYLVLQKKYNHLTNVYKNVPDILDKNLDLNI